MAVEFVDWGQDCHLTGGSLEDAVNDGVARGYVDGHLRLSVVADPLRRGNTNNNTPAILHLRMVPGDRVDLTVAPKGFGSENMSSLRMFNPSVTQEQVEDHIVDCVARAGSNPCPPVIVGVGLGGTSEVAAELAKRALLLLLRQYGAPVSQRRVEDFLAAVRAGRDWQAAPQLSFRAAGQCFCACAGSWRRLILR